LRPIETTGIGTGATGFVQVAGSRALFNTQTEALPGIPPLEFRYGVRFHQACKAPKWTVELGFRTDLAQDNVAVSLNELPTPGFTVLDLRSFWQPSDHWLFTAGVENLTNHFYREHLDPRSGAPSDLLFRPGTNAYITAQLKY
jgi:outer membrane receptor protein involved in Fe transport